VNNAIEFKLDENTVNNSSVNSNKNNVSRANLLLGIFQENASNKKIIEDFTKKTNKNPPCVSKDVSCLQSKTETKSIISHYKESEEKNTKSIVEIEKEIKLVRIFPGPAGLVPDTKNDSIPPASYLSSAIELENKITKRIETNLTKSQDEKNLFDEKAWKLLLDDLPNGFFNEYGIFTMMNRANASYCSSMKVKFVAGMIDYIDHSRDNPLIILKDSTGSIEGTIHRDIALSYPDILKPNIALLLRNVGLLKIVTYVITNKYHILISKANLLAIYSNKGCIVSTSPMEDVFSSISDSELDEDQCMPSLEHLTDVELQQTNKNYDNALSQTTSSINVSINDHKSISESSKKCSKQNAKKNVEACKIATKSIFEDNCSMNMDDLDMNDIFAIDCEFTNSTKPDCLNRSSSKSVSRTNEIQQDELQIQCINYMENTKKKSMIHFENKKENKMQNLSQTLQKCITDVAVADARHQSCEDRLSPHDNHAHGAQKDSKPTSSTIKHNADNTKNLLNYFGDSKYDSDDEFLSQLDIDNISNNVKEKY